MQATGTPLQRNLQAKAITAGAITGGGKIVKLNLSGKTSSKKCLFSCPGSSLPTLGRDYLSRASNSIIHQMIKSKEEDGRGGRCHFRKGGVGMRMTITLSFIFVF